MFNYDELERTIANVRSKDIFFIMGVMKSGTTWLQLLLDGHPQIVCRGEGHFTNYLSQALDGSAKRYNAEIDFKNKNIFGEIGGFPLLQREHVMFLLASAAALLLAEYANEGNARVIGEKTPDNVLNAPILQNLFPGAKFIHIIRDPRDCAVSAWFHNIRVSPDWVHENFTGLEDYVKKFAGIWAEQVRTGREFGKENPECYSELRYEDLHSDPPTEISRLLELLGVDADPTLVERCCEAGSFQRLSGRSRGVEDRKSFFRRGGIGNWRDHLDASADGTFQSRAGALMQELGYG